MSNDTRPATRAEAESLSVALVFSTEKVEGPIFPCPYELLTEEVARGFDPKAWNDDIGTAAERSQYAIALRADNKERRLKARIKACAAIDTIHARTMEPSAAMLDAGMACFTDTKAHFRAKYCFQAMHAVGPTAKPEEGEKP